MMPHMPGKYEKIYYPYNRLSGDSRAILSRQKKMTSENYVRGVAWGFHGVKEWRCGKNSHEQTGP